MPQALQPKIRSRNPLQTQRRLHCQANGWSCVPCEGKSRLPKGWPTLPNGPEDIRGWNDPKSGMRPFEGTGVRVEGLLCVLDIDVTHAGAVEALLARLYKAYPELRRALVRRSGSTKVALFFLVSKPIGMKRTARYGDGDVVEIFGSLVTRYFAIDGPHSVPGRFYTWDAGSPWDTRLDALPVIDAESIGDILDLCEEAMGEHLTRIPNSTRSETIAMVSYTLEPGQTYITTEGDEIELTVLEGMIVPGTEIRGLMTREDWNASVRKNHCNAVTDHRGRLVITDFQADVKYRWKDDEPHNIAAIDDELVEALRELGTETAPKSPPTPPEDAVQGEPRQPGTTDGWNAQVAWMLASFAQSEAGQVIRLYATTSACAQSVKAFDDYYAMYNRPKPPPAKTLDYASKIWKLHPLRKSVASHDMRPDQPFPLFDEDGRRIKNTYTPVRHSGEGEVETCLRFFQHLVPNDQAYFRGWLAHKWQHPEVPGHALIMVAAGDEGGEQAGTGRGTLFKILERLFGRRYVRHLDFNILTGQSAQGVYTDWMADSLLVCVDESREGTGRFGERRSAYEHLKARCDPAPRWMTVHGKNQPARDSFICCSYIIATNHADALMIPASDRRFAVLSNGDKLSVADANAIYAWMDVPGNIAALARWLAAQDVSAFNATGWPPITAARNRMMEMSESEMDRLVREALWALKGLAFTRHQLKLAMYNIAGDNEIMQSGAAHAQLTQILRTRMRGLRVPGPHPRRERRFRVPGEDQVRAYVRSAGDEARCDAMSSEEVQAEIARNGVQEVEVKAVK